MRAARGCRNHHAVSGNLGPRFSHYVIEMFEATRTIQVFDGPEVSVCVRGRDCTLVVTTPYRVFNTHGWNAWDALCEAEVQARGLFFPGALKVALGPLLREAHRASCIVHGPTASGSV